MLLRAIYGGGLLLILAAAACGEPSAPDVPPGPAAPDHVTVAPAELTEVSAFTKMDLDNLIAEAQSANQEYGFAAACLYPGDFTAGGWGIPQINGLISEMGLPATVTAVGVLGMTAEGNTYLSLYDSDYTGATVTNLEKIETGGKICYSPVIP